MESRDTGRSLIWHGVFLFLLGLLTGCVIPAVTSPRLGLSAHMEALLNGMFLVLVRAMRGPSVFERVLAANSFNSKTLLLILVAGFLLGDPADYIDIAMMYAIIGFIGTVAVLRCVEYGGFTDGDEDDE